MGETSILIIYFECLERLPILEGYEGLNDVYIGMNSFG